VKARDVVGRRIVGVRQQRFYDQELRQWATELTAIELDNGALLKVMSIAHGEEPYVQGWVEESP